MISDPTHSNLPTELESELSGLPKVLIPRSIKALDRLLGAAVDIPVAWLESKKKKIDAESASAVTVEVSIADAAAQKARTNPEIVEKAMEALVRKAYRKEKNVRATSAFAIENLLSETEETQDNQINNSATNVDEDWLNVFERHAEDASTERMQQLWGRVLSGEIRRPGRFSLRTIRFLAEFSRQDAELFTSFLKKCFPNNAPKNLFVLDSGPEFANLLVLEFAGLIQGVSSSLRNTLEFDEAGFAYCKEGSVVKEESVVIVYKGHPRQKVAMDAMFLTNLGEELLILLPERDTVQAARAVGLAMRNNAKIDAAFLCSVDVGSQEIRQTEILWETKESSEKPNEPK